MAKKNAIPEKWRVVFLEKFMEVTAGMTKATGKVYDTPLLLNDERTLLALDRAFIVLWSFSAGTASISEAICCAVRESGLYPFKTIPLVITPFMGKVGIARCKEAGVLWFDLSGNARIIVPGLHILIHGKPNLHKERGRPVSTFSPAASRVVRWLLMHPDKPITRHRLAAAIGSGAGYVSKVIRRLEDEGFLIRDNDGAVCLLDPTLLLDAWAQNHDFDRDHIIQGCITARDGPDRLHLMVDVFDRTKTSYAATGLTAAWMLDGYTTFDLTTVYLDGPPRIAIRTALGFEERDDFVNTWLVAPRDQGVFHGSSIVDGVRCVHPVQAYVDLQAHPERAVDAAESLRERVVDPLYSFKKLST